MEKYATYNYYENNKTGKIKKIALHDKNNNLVKTAAIEEWVKITNKDLEKKLENQEQ